jgi:hypothetical protein
METRRLIITCEECGEVKHFDVDNDEHVDEIFTSFQCPNKCSRNFYSYITISEITMNRSSRNKTEQTFQTA